MALVQAKFTKNHCCVNNIPRGFINFAQGTLATDNESLYINLYSPLEAMINVGGRNVKVCIRGEYLSTCRASVSIAFDSEPVPVKLRVPKWSKHSEIKFDGKVYAAEPGYFTLETKNTSLEVEIVFDDEIKVVRIAGDSKLGDIEWKRQRWISARIDNSEKEYVSADPDLFISGEACVLVRGATLLCRTKLIGNTENEMFGERMLTEAYKCIECKRLNNVSAVNTELQLTFSDGNNILTYHVADYASGTNFKTEDKRYFSIYF